MTVRYSIWTAVSTAAQAAGDKVSLEVQETRCREAATLRGWKETSGPYIVEGESRQRWVNLRDAEMEIPQLHLLLEDAQAGRYDVLVLYDYNRLRDLLDLVSQSLRHYRVQIFSVTQPVEPMQPDKYNPYASDIAVYMQLMAQTTSRLQNNDLRRKYAEAMPKRVTQRGLPAGGNVPFGYMRGINSKTPPSVLPDIAAIVIEMKDRFLTGQSTTQIAEWLDATIPAPKAPKWYPQTVKAILVNPFYAGILRWGVSRSRLDPRSGRTKRDRKIPPDQYVTGPGKHVPLWDEYTYHAIMNEMRRRGHSYRGRAMHKLTSLLTCGVCGKRLWTFYNSSNRPENMIWRCSSREEHVSLLNTKALWLVSERIRADISKLDPTDKAPIAAEAIEVRAELAVLKGERSRIGDGFQAGAFDLSEFTLRTGPLDGQIAELEHNLQSTERLEKDHEARQKAIYYLQEHQEHIPAFIETSEAQQVNYLLRSVLFEIVVFGGDEIELKWR